MPPCSSPPNCTMHSPSTTIGEHEVKNRGNFLVGIGLRHRTFPLAASRHESVPRTPSVMTFPSATVGDRGGRGSGKPRRSGFSFVLVGPLLFARVGIEAGDDFVSAAASEDVEPIADERGSGDAVADGDGPFLRELFGHFAGR